MNTGFFIVLDLSISIVLLTAFQKRSRPQQLTLCWSLHAEALQATASEGLGQGPHVALERDSNSQPSGRKDRLYQCTTTPYNTTNIFWAYITSCCSSDSIPREKQLKDANEIIVIAL